jgi:hypothetical protein
MGSAFDNRERALEDKFHHDQSIEFKIQARRNRLFGLWVAEQLGLKDHDAESYARALIAHTLKIPGDEALLALVLDDITKKKVKLYSLHQLQKKLGHFQEDARDQLMKE